MARISQKQIEAVQKIDREKRLKHFIKRVCDWEEVWSIKDHDWVFSETDDGTKVFQVWPHDVYARLYCVGERADCQPASLELEDFMENYLCPFQEEGIQVGVFYTTSENGYGMEAGYLGHLLSEELDMYY